MTPSLRMHHDGRGNRKHPEPERVYPAILHGQSVLVRVFAFGEPGASPRLRVGAFDPGVLAARKMKRKAEYEPQFQLWNFTDSEAEFIDADD